MKHKFTPTIRDIKMIIKYIDFILDMISNEYYDYYLQHYLSDEYYCDDGRLIRLQ